MRRIEKDAQLHVPADDEPLDEFCIEKTRCIPCTDEERFFVFHRLVRDTAFDACSNGAYA